MKQAGAAVLSPDLYRISRISYRTASIFIILSLSSVGTGALPYKPKGRGLETRGGSCISSIYLVLLAALGPGIYSDRNEWQRQI
jgi:hypothetical protein